MDIIFHASHDQALEAARKTLLEQLENLAPKLLMLSGGSSSKLLEDINWENYPSIKTIILDERFNHDLNLNNSLNLKKIGVPVEEFVANSAENLDNLAKRFEARLKTFFKEYPDHKVIAVMGMGADGHVAGISPIDDETKFNQLFVNNPEQWVVGYSGSLTPPDRITVRVPFLKDKIDQAIVFACGENKNQVMDKLMQSKLPLHKFPAMVFYQMKSVRIFTDQVGC